MSRLTPLAAGLLSALTLSRSAMALEEPSYRVLEAAGAFELRAYAPHVVAAVEVEGERGEALSRGFRLLAGYIFGNNRARAKVEMTAPVAQAAQPEKLQMTAPVTGQLLEGGRWKVTFLMPSQYTLATLPVPNDGRVRHEQVPGRTVAALRFNGWATDGNVARHLTALREHLDRKGLQPAGEPLLAQYDPPWAFPCWRRNEWLVEVSGPAG